VVAQGPRDACQRLLDLLESGNTPGDVEKVVADWTEVGDAMTGFTER
jgi:acylphosphatase